MDHHDAAGDPRGTRGRIMVLAVYAATHFGLWRLGDDRRRAELA